MILSRRLSPSPASTTASLDPDLDSWRRSLEDMISHHQQHHQQFASSSYTHHHTTVVDDDDDEDTWDDDRYEDDGFGGRRRKDPESDYAFGGRKSRPHHHVPVPAHPDSVFFPSLSAPTTPVSRSYTYHYPARSEYDYTYVYTADSASGSSHSEGGVRNRLRKIRNATFGRRYEYEEEADQEEVQLDEDEFDDNVYPDFGEEDEETSCRRSRTLMSFLHRTASHSPCQTRSCSPSRTSPTSTSLQRTTTLPASLPLSSRTHRQWTAFSLSVRLKVFRAQRSARQRWGEFKKHHHQPEQF